MSRFKFVFACFLATLLVSWRESVSLASPESQNQPLEVPALVIGTGVGGVFTALYLQFHLNRFSFGKQVTLIGDSASHKASSLAAGTLFPKGRDCPTNPDDPNYTSDYLSVATSQIYRKLSAHRDIGYVPCGAAYVATQAKQRKRLEYYYQAWKDSYPEIQFLETKKDLSQFDSALDLENTEAVLSLPSGGFVDPVKLNEETIRLCEETGVQVLDEVVLSISRQRAKRKTFFHRFAGHLGQNDDFLFQSTDHRKKEAESVQYLVKTNRSSYLTSHLTLAMGEELPSFAEKLGYKIPSKIIKGQIAAIDDTKNISKRFSHPKRVYVLSELEDGEVLTHDPVTGKPKRDFWYLRPDPSSEETQTLVGGGRFISHSRDYEGYSLAMLQTVRSASHVFPALRLTDTTILPPYYVCRMAFSEDGLPWVGYLDPIRFPGLSIVGGFGPLGISQAACAGALAGIQIGEKIRDPSASLEDPILERLDPRRKSSGILPHKD